MGAPHKQGWLITNQRAAPCVDSPSMHNFYFIPCTVLAAGITRGENGESYMIDVALNYYSQ